MKNDIFISYKADSEGSNFAARLYADLDKSGYSVYLNTQDVHCGSFPEHIREAIYNCNDFILILTKACLKQLVSNERIDWVRTEILYANDYGKNIIPVLVGSAEMPKDKDVMPECLRFIPDKNAKHLPTDYLTSPYEELTYLIKSKPHKEIYRDVANSNPDYDVSKDLAETLSRAESGDIEAMFEVGFMYFHGFADINDNNGKLDYANAAKWLKAVSEANHQLSPYADVMIAKMYYNGLMPSEDQSIEKSSEYYQKANDSNPGSYTEHLLFLKSVGIGDDCEPEMVIKQFLECYRGCSNNIKNSIASYFMDYGLFDKAIEVLESIDGIFPYAEYRLGTLYQRGVHCKPPKPDMYRAEHHFMNAADFGHLDSIHALGLINFRGAYGYRQNLPRARNFYKTAAEAGHRGAQYDYAWMLKNGVGGPKDIETAIVYFEKSAQAGHHISMSELSSLYQEKECRNYQKAFEWAQKSAETGDPYGEFNLANLYFFGRGCDHNTDKAVIYYRKALAHGLYQAKFMLDKVTSNIK